MQDHTLPLIKKINPRVFSGMCMGICMLVPYGQPVKTQKTVATLAQARFPSAAETTLLYLVPQSQEAVFQLLATFSHSGRTTAKTSLFCPARVFIELFVLAAVITLAPRKMLLLLQHQVLLLRLMMLGG